MMPLLGTALPSCGLQHPLVPAQLLKASSTGPPLQLLETSVHQPTTLTTLNIQLRH